MKNVKVLAPLALLFLVACVSYPTTVNPNIVNIIFGVATVIAQPTAQLKSATPTALHIVVSATATATPTAPAQQNAPAKSAAPAATLTPIPLPTFAPMPPADTPLPTVANPPPQTPLPTAALPLLPPATATPLASMTQPPPPTAQLPLPPLVSPLVSPLSTASR